MIKPKFAVVVPTPSFEQTRTLAERAEASGFDAVAIEDHYFIRGAGQQPQEPRLECFTAVAALAMATKRVKLTQLVACNSFRHPAMTAKIAASIDHISGGRLELGLGAGWFREEYDALSMPYPQPRVRVEQLAEALRIIKKLWSEPVTNFEGKHYRLHGFYAEPKPLQKPRPKIMLGGSGPGLLRLAAEEADILNMIPPTGGKFGEVVIEDALKFDAAEFRRRTAILHDHARKVGRDPGEIELSQFPFVLMGTDRASADAMIAAMAQMMGVKETDGARHSPSTLVGDAEQCRDEIQRRVDELGVTYFFCRFMDVDMMNRFVDQVIAKL
ncbi:MAG TPA: LLM class flavin-dependent oxidoreductase [Candidatus Binataceae bacterium]|nr:LLM class flavin-dependent oxidoreductase [Candidatus Binataceae bacterium]